MCYMLIFEYIPANKGNRVVNFFVIHLCVNPWSGRMADKVQSRFSRLGSGWCRNTGFLTNPYVYIFYIRSDLYKDQPWRLCSKKGDKNTVNKGVTAGEIVETASI